MRWLVFVVVVALPVVATGCSRPPALAMAWREAGQDRVPGEYLVSLAARADAKVITNVYGRFRIKRIERLDLSDRNIFLVGLSEDPGLAKMDELRRQDGRIEAVQPNYVYRAN